MEIEDLRTFVEVADAGGVNSAARRLGLAKSIVSRRVLRLEEELGVQLLARTTRGAALTEAGALFRDRAADVCATIEAAREEMSPEGELQGLLRIAAPASFAAQLAQSLAELGRRHPALHVHIRFNDRYVDLVAEGFDCGIRVGYLPDSNLVARKIGSLAVRLYASPDYINQHGAPGTPADVLKHNAITPGTDAWTFTKADTTVTVHPQGRFKADSAHVLVEAAIAGIGIVAMGEIVAEPFVQKGALVPIMTDYELPPVGIYVVRPPGQNPARKVRVLIDLLAQEFAAVRVA
ncbi:LysR family transcriptional regulator [Rhizobium lentis]|uniref:LysR family transcriptional regulator n=1 Tax=Rhizobium lentis TaxID=1138194 RepID=UPI001C82D9A4|nr:LysR family transcriptional regulator [Rhizobium lentis]MBX5141360.1 LysR family transcriptional regulator [Rhizobium lentis]MBX5179037.1 LysR family transcriptional regulator [Rhizobium lentis]